MREGAPEGAGGAAGAEPPPLDGARRDRAQQRGWQRLRMNGAPPTTDSGRMDAKERSAVQLHESKAQAQEPLSWTASDTSTLVGCSSYNIHYMYIRYGRLRRKRS